MPEVPDGGFALISFARFGNASQRTCESRVLPFDNRHAGGVVAAIFEATQAFEKDGSRFRFPT